MIIDLHPTEDQELIADSIGRMLGDQLPISRLREEGGRNGAIEREYWSDFAELGLFSMGLSEQDGGAGYGLPEETIAAYACGSVLASPSLIAQMAAVHLTDGDERAALVAGTKSAAFATISYSGEVIRFDGRSSDLVVLLGEGATLIPSDSFNWSIATGIDETIAVCTAPSAPVAIHPRDNIADRISLLLAAALSGMAQAATVIAIDYAKQREQFGQPIGSFQSIKHMLADMRVEADAAYSQTRVAAVTFGQGEADRREVAAARWLAGKAALANARSGIQVHGGMGFTAECDAHLFLKRAQLFANLGSSRRAEERRLLDL